LTNNDIIAPLDKQIMSHYNNLGVPK